MIKEIGMVVAGGIVLGVGQMMASADWKVIAIGFIFGLLFSSAVGRWLL